ncbi:hypothetical protein CBER1_00260 [Cercospora berteroae]|uniref:Uncharacterized protein n=1 Tax=Cercospora berteroae TaxID=357750 RepID=A0A2S6CD65_9PEZI|nr:hypothetical protein CBER1_00260 [Cercospora berteroae]
MSPGRARPQRGPLLHTFQNDHRPSAATIPALSGSDGEQKRDDEQESDNEQDSADEPGSEDEQEIDDEQESVEEPETDTEKQLFEGLNLPQEFKEDGIHSTWLKRVLRLVKVTKTTAEARYCLLQVIAKRAGDEQTTEVKRKDLTRARDLALRRAGGREAVHNVTGFPGVSGALTAAMGQQAGEATERDRVTKREEADATPELQLNAETRLGLAGDDDVAVAGQAMSNDGTSEEVKTKTPNVLQEELSGRTQKRSLHMNNRSPPSRNYARNPVHDPPIPPCPGTWPTKATPTSPDPAALARAMQQRDKAKKDSNANRFDDKSG